MSILGDLSLPRFPRPPSHLDPSLHCPSMSSHLVLPPREAELETVACRQVPHEGIVVALVRQIVFRWVQYLRGAHRREITYFATFGPVNNSKDPHYSKYPFYNTVLLYCGVWRERPLSREPPPPPFSSL